MRILITGAPGQDATLLSQLMLERGHDVTCSYRYSSTDFKSRFKHFPVACPNLQLVCGSITTMSGCLDLLEKVEPDQVYNLAASSHVSESFKDPAGVFDINLKPIIYFLEGIRRFSPGTRFLQASTSEMFGSNYSVKNGQKVQDENTPLSGNSPYAISKIAAHNMVKLYREAYGVFACAAISFNHEHPGLRGENFVTRKITKWVCNFIRWKNANGLREPNGFSETEILFEGLRYPKLRLGNLDAVRDWSDAFDVVNAMTLILGADEPDDYVVCSGKGHTVHNFLELAFSYAFIDNFMDYVYIDPAFYRPCEVPFLQGDATKLRERLGWEPRTDFKELVRSMVEYDCGNPNRH